MTRAQGALSGDGVVRGGTFSVFHHRLKRHPHFRAENIALATNREADMVAMVGGYSLSLMRSDSLLAVLGSALWRTPIPSPLEGEG